MHAPTVTIVNANEIYNIENNPKIYFFFGGGDFFSFVLDVFQVLLICSAALKYNDASAIKDLKYMNCMYVKDKTLQ
jgi:hypothetical protein